MAFLSRKKEEDALKSEQILLDATLMQNLQDRFCDANNLYLRCLDKNRTEVTKTYGSKEELEYLGSVIDMDKHIGLLERLLEQEAEDAFEERKSMARKLGEEAGTKMLFPMILMLGAVMLILAFPAMRSMEL